MWAMQNASKVVVTTNRTTCKWTRLVYTFSDTYYKVTHNEVVAKDDYLRYYYKLQNWQLHISINDIYNS